MVASVVLLAGNSSRMGRPKQHVLIGECSFLDYIVKALTCFRTEISPLIFIGQAGDLQARSQVIAGGGIWEVNEKPENGPLSSIHIALKFVPADCGFLLWPVDHPLVNVATIRSLLDAVAADPSRIVVPSFEGRRGHPTIFPSWTKSELLAAPLEKGAKWVLEKHPGTINHVIVQDRWTRKNINTPELLREACRVD